MKGPLSTKQELRLISYLDDKLTETSRHFETRHSLRAALPTIQAYLKVLTSLQSFVLEIPPAGTSAPLRVAYLLQITSLLPDAFAAYPLDPTALPPTFTFLALFDRAWLAVLRGQEWDTVDLEGKGSAGDTGVRGTDRVRLESIILDARETLRAMLGVPVLGQAKVDLDPTMPMVEPAYRIPEGAVDVQAAVEEVEEETPISCVAVGVDVEVRIEEVEPTPSLITDEGTQDEDGDEPMEEDADSEDEDEDEFEEVDVASPSPPVGDDDASSFSIHFQAPPRAAPEVVEEPERRKGFDPDAEYGMDDDDEEGDGGDGDEDGIEADEALKQRVSEVFKETMAELEALKAQ